jgi:release factor glutamine methyltransferase
MTITANVDTLLAEGVRRLSAVATGDTGAAARLEAGVLLAHVLAVPRARLSSHPEAPVAATPAESYRSLLLRRAAGEPLAYLTGRREFWSLELAVNPAVLVPRPETELLVERALALGPASRARVADLGTGCGAIARRSRWRAPMPQRSDAHRSNFAPATGTGRSPASASSCC